MAMKLRLGGEWKDIAACKIFSGGAWRSVVAIKDFESATWRDLANFTPASPPPPSGGGGGGGGGSITLSISPSPVEQAGSTPIVTAGVGATPSGGLAPYTYSWAIISGGGITATSPTSASTGLRATLGPGGSAFATFRCTCTDSLGVTASADVDVTLSRES